ncbi:MAG TPA: L,D-transpeptidase [Polyangiaceae bacterium]|nr:L,D-transpeptidase [Polyangiaceae bacterium]
MRSGLAVVLAAVAFATGCGRTDHAPPLTRIASAAAPVTTAAEPVPSAAAPKPPRAAPRVTLTGESRPEMPAPPGYRRIYARAARTWVYERPSEDAPHVAYLRAGGSVPVNPEIAGRKGCPGGFHALPGQGFVCDGAAATFDDHDPVVAALSTHLPDPSRKLPYIYGTVRKPGPVYARLPSADELARAEPGIESRMKKWLSADGEVGASYAQFVWLGHPGDVPDPAAAWNERRSENVPAFLLGGGAAPNLHQKPREAGQLVVGRTRAKVGFSFTETFLHEGRRYGVTPELEILPTDRLRPIQGSEFHGVPLGNGVTLPLALVREPGTHYVVLERRSNSLHEGELAPYREAIPLTGKQQFFHGVLHYETKDGKWLSDRDASRLDPAKRLPGWAVKGERWIDVNITKQTLVLYEGTTPVYATLISSGEAGLGDSATSTATKRGIFRIHAKHVATTMASDEVGEEFELRDVPYVQYFDDGGHAIHGAYWHDRFGIPKSHGCINLAPEDARRVFYFTDPPVEDGEHGAFDALTGTVVFIHA